MSPSRSLIRKFRMLPHLDTPSSSIRDAVVRILAEFVRGEALADVQETLLLRAGVFCGRRFNVDGWNAIWFGEENELKVFRPDGTLACVTQLPQPVRRAA